MTQDINKLEMAKAKIISTKHLYPRYFTEDEIGKTVFGSGPKYGELTKSRYNALINAISVMYHSGSYQLDDVNMDTFLEIHFLKDEILLLVSETLKGWLREKNITECEEMANWSLKYKYSFNYSEYDKVIELVNYLIEKYGK